MEKKFHYEIINLAALMILIYVGILNIQWLGGILAKAISLLFPFIVGFVFAYALTPLVNYLKKKKIPTWLAIIMVVGGILLFLLAIISITIPMLYEQLSSLIQNLMKVFQNIHTKFDVNIGSFELKITDYLNEILKSLGTMTSSTTLGFVSNFIGFFGKFIVGFVGFLYFLIDMDKIRHQFKNFLLSINKNIFDYVKCMDIEISHYLQGLEIFMIVQFFEYSILFLIIGHPNWLILGILACITTVIPYFGGLITNVIAIILASVVSLPLLIATSIICIIFPQLDGYLISPRIYGKTNNVNPLITIMAVSVGGTLFGVLGIIISLPCYLILRTTYHFFAKDLGKKVRKIKGTEKKTG